MQTPKHLGYNKKDVETRIKRGSKKKKHKYHVQTVNLTSCTIPTLCEDFFLICKLCDLYFECNTIINSYEVYNNHNPNGRNPIVRDCFKTVFQDKLNSSRKCAGMYRTSVRILEIRIINIGVVLK